jgi:hypothetical protein
VAFRRRSIPRLLSLDLQDLILIQDANPQQPVLEIPKLGASVEWEALLFGRLVANLSVDRPTLIRRPGALPPGDHRRGADRGAGARGAPGHLSKVGKLRINEATIHVCRRRGISTPSI